MKYFIFGFLLIFLMFSNAFSQNLSATIIGSGSPMYDKNRSSASVLISKGNTKILVDMGNGTQANLAKAGINPRNISALLFTHHHLDHNEEFTPILIRLLLGRNDFDIVGPPNTTKLTKTNIELYEEDIEYRLSKSRRSLTERINAVKTKDLTGGESFSINDIKISTLEVPHTIHTLAYRFDDGETSIVVTGDLTYSDKLHLLAKDANYMIIDSGGMIMDNEKRRNKKNKKPKRNKTKAHLNLADSSQIANDANVKNLVYTHFRKGIINEEASLIEIRKNYKGNVIFGEDLMHLTK